MEKIESQLEKVKIAPAGDDSRLPVVLAAKKPPGKEGRPVKIRTNCKRISFKKEYPIFKYDVSIKFTVPKGEDKTINLDFLRDARRDPTIKTASYALIAKLASTHSDHFGSVWVYDRVAMLYGLKKMEERVWELPKDFVKGLPADAINVTVTISPCRDSFQSSYRDVAECCNRRQSEQKRELLEFMNLLINNEALKRPQVFITCGNVHYFYDPFRYGFQQKEFPDLEHAQYIGSGIAATAHVGTFQGKPSLYMVADVKKSVFHADGMTLLQKMQQLGLGQVDSRTTINPLIQKVMLQSLKNIGLSTTYGRPQKFNMQNFGPVAAQMSFPKSDGSQVTLVDYYKTQYKINLKYPNLPLIRSSRGNYFPIELLKVDDSQVVSNAQMSASNQGLVIRSSAVPPSIRFSQTEKSVAAMELSSQNKTFVEAGVLLDDKFITVPGRELPPPGIHYKNGSVSLMGNYRWTLKEQQKYIIPGNLSKWGVVLALTPGDKKYLNCDEFIVVLMRIMQSRGMTVGAPIRFELNDQSDSGVQNLFQKAASAGVPYLFVISTESIRIHDQLKVCEQKFQIMTQEVKSIRVKRIQTDTMNNIIHKSNLKLGGVCHTVTVSNAKANSWLNSDVLAVGLEFSHAPPQNASVLAKQDNKLMPSVVGWGATCADHPQKVIGDYLFIEARNNEALTSELAKLFKTLCSSFKENRKKSPSQLIVYFSGISSGQWELIGGDFKEAIAKGCAAVTRTPKMLLIAVSKIHEERFYKESIDAAAKPPAQNITPGTVVGTDIVSPVLNEFYLNAHSAIQGTASTPKYTVIFDDTDVDNDVIQGVTHGYCFLHEVVPAAVSLPAMLMVADRCAERGHKNYVYVNRERRGDPMSPEEANLSLTNPAGGALAGVRYNS